MGLIAGIVAAVVLVGGGVGAYLWFASTGSNLAKYAPKDTHTFFEVPSTTKALVSAIGMDVINTDELDTDKSKSDVIDAFASSFGIEKDQAEDILTGVSAVAVASRRIERKDDDFGPRSEDVMLIKMSSAGDVKPLLESKRFKEQGDLANGKEYKLFRKEVDEDKEEKLSEFEKAFNNAGDRKEEKGSKDDEDEDDGDKKKKKEKNREVLVWFEDEALFAIGRENMVEDVGKLVKDGGDSLKDNENFKKAKWESGSAALFFMNPEFADKDEKKDVFSDVGPITGSLKFDDGGLVVSGHAELKGKKIPKNDDLLAEEVSLTLHEKLPADTIGYVAFSAKWKGDGKAVQKALVKAADGGRDDEDKSKTFEEQLDDMEKNIGFSFDVLLDAVGDEGIIAVTADSKTELETLMKGKQDAAKEAAEHMGLVAIFHVGDKDKADKLVKTLKDTIEDKGKEAVELKKKDGGFYVEPAESVREGLMGGIEVGLQVTVEDEKHIVVAVGSKKRIDAILAAFKGEGDTLKDDKGHKKALSAVGDKGQLLAWIDVGRIGKKALEDAGDMKKDLKKKGFNLDAIVLEGDNRVTIAGLARIVMKDEMMTIDVSTLNAPIAAAASGFMFLARLGSDMDMPKKRGGGDTDFSEPPKPTKPAGGGPPPTGMPACDSYLTRMYNCADKMGAGADQIRKSMMDSADAYKKSGANPAVRPSIEEACRKASESIPPMCN